MMKKTTVFCITLLLLVTAQLLAQDSKVIFKGEWERESRWTTFEGSWQIVRIGERYKVVLGDDFEAKKAPDLKIFLSKASLDDINGKNAIKNGSPVLVAKLNSYKGKASYDIPKGINPSDYQSIIIHCEEYSKLWGGSLLR